MATKDLATKVARLDARRLNFGDYMSGTALECASTYELFLRGARPTHFDRRALARDPLCRMRAVHKYLFYHIYTILPQVILRHMA